MGRSVPPDVQRRFHPNRQIANPAAGDPVSPRGSDHLLVRPRRFGGRCDREADEGEVEGVDLPAELVAKLVSFLCLLFSRSAGAFV